MKNDKRGQNAYSGEWGPGATSRWGIGWSPGAWGTEDKASLIKQKLSNWFPASTWGHTWSWNEGSAISNLESIFRKNVLGVRRVIRGLRAPEIIFLHLRVISSRLNLKSCSSQDLHKTQQVAPNWITRNLQNGSTVFKNKLSGDASSLLGYGTRALYNLDITCQVDGIYITECWNIKIRTVFPQSLFQRLAAQTLPTQPTWLPVKTQKS